MSSDGGRWPRKLRNLPWVLDGVGEAGFERESDKGGTGGANALSGSGTPKLLRIDIELARFICLAVRVSALLEDWLCCDNCGIEGNCIEEATVAC